MYKGQAVKVEEVGRELGVRYVLEGSTRKAGKQVRVTAQLVEVSTSHHVWAEKYDRPLTDIFALQDDIVQQIGAALRVEVLDAEHERVRRMPTDNLTAYDAWLRGREQSLRFTEEGMLQGRQLFEQAITLDPQYAAAYTGLGWTYWLEWNFFNQAPPLLARAGELAQHALALNDSLPVAHTLLGYVYFNQKQLEQAVAEGERALALDANNVFSYIGLAEILTFAGRPKEAVGMAQQAMRLNPHYPAFYPYTLGQAYLYLGQYDEAISALRDCLRRNPNLLAGYSRLAESYLYQWRRQASQDPQILAHAEESAQQFVTRSPATYLAHGVLSMVYVWQKRYAEAEAAAEQALVLNSHDALSQAFMGNVLNFVGQPATTLARMDQVRCAKARSVPAFCFSVLGDAQYLTGRYEEALGAFSRALSSHPEYQGLYARLGLAASYSEMGRADQAREEIAAVLKMNLQFSLAGVQQRWPYKDPANLERFVTALRKAGLE